MAEPQFRNKHAFIEFDGIKERSEILILNLEKRLEFWITKTELKEEFTRIMPNIRAFRPFRWIATDDNIVIKFKFMIEDWHDWNGGLGQYQILKCSPLKTLKPIIAIQSKYIIYIHFTLIRRRFLFDLD